MGILNSFNKDDYMACDKKLTDANLKSLTLITEVCLNY